MKSWRDDYFEKNVRPYLSFKRQLMNYNPILIITGLPGSGRITLMNMLRLSLQRKFPVKTLSFDNGDFALCIGLRNNLPYWHKELPSDKWYINPEKFKGGEFMAKAKSVKKSFELEAKIFGEGAGELDIKKGNSTIYAITLSERVIQSIKKELKTNDLKGYSVRIIIK